MLLQEIQDSLAFVKDQLSAMDGLIEDKQAEVPELERQVRAARAVRRGACTLTARVVARVQQRVLEEEMSQFAALDTERTKAEGLTKHLAWAHVSEAEAKVEEGEAKVEEAKSKQPRIEAAIKSYEEKLKAAQAEKSQKTKAMADYTAASAATVDQRKAAALVASKARKAEEDARRQVAATQQERGDLQRKAAKLTEARETARQTQQRETQVETSAADAIVARARAAFEQAKAVHGRVKAEETAAVQAIEEARSDVDNLSSAADELSREEREARDMLQRLQSTQRDGLTAFGAGMPALVRGAPFCFSQLLVQANAHLACRPPQPYKITSASSARRLSAPWAPTCACLTAGGAWSSRRRSATSSTLSWWPPRPMAVRCRRWPPRWAYIGRR